MELTGKAKEQFEEWMHPSLASYYKYGKALTANFYSLPEAMRWGLYQDFADSLGIEIYAEKGLCREGFVSLTDTYPCGYFNTRPEARADAINKLNERLNK